MNKSVVYLMSYFQVLQLKMKEITWNAHFHETQFNLINLTGFIFIFDDKWTFSFLIKFGRS